MTSLGNRLRRLPAVVLTATTIAAAVTSTLHARTRPVSGPTFAVVSVTASTSTDSGKGRMNYEPGGGFTATHVTLRQLIEMAYRRSMFDQPRISGGPAWIDTDRFDVRARAAGEHVIDPDGAPRQTALMLQRLLEDRFRLKVRQQLDEGPAHALVVAREDGRLGPALTRSTVDCAAFMLKMLKGERPEGGPQCGFGPYPRRLVGRAVTMEALAGYLSSVLKRPVLDKTGLTGGFDLEVEGVEVVQPGPPGPSTRPSTTTRSIVEMLPEQLGLRLEETRAPVETIVIEHAEKPAAQP